MGLSERKFLLWLAATTDAAAFSAAVRGGAGRLFTLLRDGTPVQSTPITSDDQTVKLDQPLGASGYVRAELRDEPAFEDPNQAAGNPPVDAPPPTI